MKSNKPKVCVKCGEVFYTCEGWIICFECRLRGASDKKGRIPLCVHITGI